MKIIAKTDDGVHFLSYCFLMFVFHFVCGRCIGTPSTITTNDSFKIIMEHT